MLYIVTYETDSGDTGVVGVYNERPTDEHLSAMIRTYLDHEIVDGVSYVYLDVVGTDKIRDLPLPDRNPISYN